MAKSMLFDQEILTKFYHAQIQRECLKNRFQSSYYSNMAFPTFLNGK